MFRYFQKLPVTIRALQYDGTQEARDRLSENGVRLTSWQDEPIEQTIAIWNELEHCFVRCPRGHWIIEGTRGEFYPHEESLFYQNYREVSS